VSNRFTIHLPDISGPPIVVRIEQTSIFAVAGGDGRVFFDSAQEVVPCLEDIDADLMLLGNGLQSGYEASIYNTSLEIIYSLERSPKVRVIQ
jgi:hypothetical protein